MAHRSTSFRFDRQLLFGFIAGFLATLVFHQIVLWVLWAVGLASFGPFSMAATKPLGVPALFSLAFWGGLWGILFVAVMDRFAVGRLYWMWVFLFGAVAPSAVALLLVLPLKGRPMGGGWQLPVLLTAFLINGAWGIGTGFFYEMLSCRFGSSRAKN